MPNNGLFMMGFDILQMTTMLIQASQLIKLFGAHIQKHINTDPCENGSKSLAFGVFCKCGEQKFYQVGVNELTLVPVHLS